MSPDVLALATFLLFTALLLGLSVAFREDEGEDEES